MATGIIVVLESLRVLLVCKHHLVYCICRGGCILQIISCIVPSSGNIYVLSGFGRMVKDISVVGVATVLNMRVISAPLLPHVVEEEICCSVINGRIYREDRGFCLSGLEVVFSAGLKICEIEAVCRVHCAVFACRLYTLQFLYSLACGCINHFKICNLSRFFTYKYSHFY